LSLYTPKPGEQDPRLLTELRAIQRSIEELYPKASSWTPVLWDSSKSSAESQTYGATTGGDYFRFGDFVFFRGRIKMNSLGTLTGADQALIGGLPYTNDTDGSTKHLHGGIYVTYTFGVTLGANYILGGYVEASAKHISLIKFNTTSGSAENTTVTEVTAAGDIIFSGWYTTNDKP